MEIVFKTINYLLFHFEGWTSYNRISFCSERNAGLWQYEDLLWTVHKIWVQKESCILPWICPSEKPTKTPINGSGIICKNIKSKWTSWHSRETWTLGIYISIQHVLYHCVSLKLNCVFIIFSCNFNWSVKCLSILHIVRTIICKCLVKIDKYQEECTCTGP